MSTPYTSQNQWDGDPVTVPADNDVATVAVANPIWETALDRTIFLAGLISDRAQIRVRGSRPKSLQIAPFHGLMVLDGGTTPVMLSLGMATTNTPTLTAGWNYLYAYNNAGAPAFEVSATAPDAARVFKTGDQSRRYLCPVRADAGGRLVPFSTIGGRTVFTNGHIYNDISASVTPPGTFSLAGLIPPTSRLALLALLPNYDSSKVVLAAGGQLGLPRYNATISPNSGGDFGALEVPLGDSQELLTMLPYTNIGGVQFGANQAGVTVALSNPGANSMLAVSVAALAITVVLATDMAGVITSTVDEVADKVAETSAAAALLCGVGSFSPGSLVTAAAATGVPFMPVASSPSVTVAGFVE